MSINILVDADSIYFANACVLKGGIHMKKTMRKNIDGMMKEIERECFMGDFRVAVKGRGNFRKDIAPSYKTNRPDLDDDMKAALNYGHDYMKDRWEAVEADGMEADDLVSIWAYQAREADEQYVICGIDKDLLQIPGNHYNFKKRTHQFIDDDQGHLLLMTQCLTGDRTDNIPGITGVGPKKAEKILSGVPMERRWNRVKAAWRGHKAGDPLLSYHLLRMLTSWEDLETVRDLFTDKTPVSKSDDGEEQNV